MRSANRHLVSKLLFCYGAAFLLMLSSCTTQRILMQAKEEQRVQSVRPDSTFLPDPGYQYQIRPDDKISVSVWNNDDVSVGSVYGIYNSNEVYGKWLMVDKKGEVAMPQLGNIKVAGLTLVQLKELLTKQIAKTILNPVIDVKILNKEVTVLGEVKAPGNHLLVKEKYSLLEVIGMAGDFDSYANKAAVRIVRTQNDQSKTITVDLRKMKDYTLSNIEIHPGDVVYVPSRKGKDWDKRAGSTIIPAASAITTAVLLLKLFL